MSDDNVIGFTPPALVPEGSRLLFGVRFVKAPGGRIWAEFAGPIDLLDSAEGRALVIARLESVVNRLRAGGQP